MNFILGAILGVIIFLAIIGLWLAGIAISSVILTWAWNLVVPIFWKTAPHLTFWVGCGIVILLGFLGRMFSRTTNVTVSK
jgi:hypothetical protein